MHAHSVSARRPRLVVCRGKPLCMAQNEDDQPVPCVPRYPRIEEAACVHVVTAMCRSAKFDPPSVRVPINQSVTISRQAEIKVVIRMRTNFKPLDVHKQSEAKSASRQRLQFLEETNIFVINFLGSLGCLSTSALLFVLSNSVR